jgi:hypothetical protein
MMHEMNQGLQPTQESVPTFTLGNGARMALVVGGSVRACWTLRRNDSHVRGQSRCNGSKEAERNVED